MKTLREDVDAYVARASSSPQTARDELARF